MFNLKNITVREFFKLDEDTAIKYVELQSIMKSKSFFLKRKARELGQLTYGEVSQLKRDMSSADYDSIIDVLRVVFNISKSDILKADVVSFFYALNHVKNSVVLLNKKEKVLIPEVDADLEMAGVKSLSVFGELATLINLGKKFSKAPTEIETWKYNLVFAILLYDKTYGDVQKRYMDLKKTKK